MANYDKYRYHINNAFFDAPLEFGNTLLCQIGRLYCHPSTVIAPHTHNNLYELTVITSGKGQIFTNGTPFNVTANDIYLSFPEEEHCIISDAADPLQYDFFAFRTKDASLREHLSRIKSTYASPLSRVFSDNGMILLVSDAISEINNEDTFSDTMLNHICEQIIIRTVRAFSTKESGSSEDRGRSEAEIICYTAMNYIDSHVTSIKSLTEISDAMNYNYSYLSFLFKKTTGRALMDYYRQRRLDEAKRLLCESGKSITSIAEILNYSSVYTFSRAFKAEYGVSPNQFKRNIRDGKI